jgi:beta-lactamase class A
MKVPISTQQRQGIPKFRPNRFEPQKLRANGSQEISRLQAKLRYAYRVIDELEQENAQLREQLIYLRDRNQPSTFPTGTVLRAPSQKAPQQFRQSPVRYRTRRPKRRFSKLSLLRFVTVATIVAMILAITGLALIRRQTRTVTPSTEPSVVLPEPLNSSLSTPFSLIPPPVTSPPANPAIPVNQPSLGLTYNAKTPPNFRYNLDLQGIVNEVVNLSTDKELPKEPLSVTLIDVKSGEFAEYQQQELRFPASVLKLFWMVVLYAQLQSGILLDKGTFTEDLYQMIGKSDNNAASRIVDSITNTESGPELSEEELQVWLNKREQINQFFQAAGYEGINISQKIYPIYELSLNEPKGRDLQIRSDSQKPNRDLVTTQHAARLMYEIVTGQAVSQKASQVMAQWLTRDLRPEAWKKVGSETGEFNPIDGFFGESLPTDVQFLSKAGWTSTSRHEVAFIRTSDGRSAYILAIFASDAAYSKDWQIFPKMSRLVFDRMVFRNYAAKSTLFHSVVGQKSAQKTSYAMNKIK